MTQWAFVRFKKFLRFFDCLRVIPQQITDFSLSRSVRQQHKLSPLHGPLAVGHMVAVDFTNEVMHDIQFISYSLNQPAHRNGALCLIHSLYPAIVGSQRTDIPSLTIVQTIQNFCAIIKKIIAGFKTVICRNDDFLLILLKQVQHFLRCSVSGQPINVRSDRGVELSKRGI